ncbi:unnamed protein product, partial [Prorocentrum cordatum]
AVIAHLQDYESSPPESTKALRALSSLAYADASKVGNDEAALAQLLRLLLIHPDAVQLQLAAMRALCNMAYDHKVALARGPRGPVRPGDRGGEAPGAEGRGGEGERGAGAHRGRRDAAHRRERHPEGDHEGPGGPLRPLPRSQPRRAVRGAGGPAGELIGQLIRNEVVEPPQVAQRFAAAGGEPCSALTAAGWLGLAKQFCLFDLQELPQLMTDAGAIAQCTKLMEKHIGDPVVQLGGIEAMSSLVGNRWAGLQSFAEVGGMRSIEAAMGAHKGDAMIQTKGVRALSSGILWPEDDIQKKSGYDTRTSEHGAHPGGVRRPQGETVELQTAALEALAKYVENKELAKLFAAAGGEQLVKDIMSQHAGTAKVKSFGDMVLTGVKRLGPAFAGTERQQKLVRGELAATGGGLGPAAMGSRGERMRRRLRLLPHLLAGAGAALLAAAGLSSRWRSRMADQWQGLRSRYELGSVEEMWARTSADSRRRGCGPRGTGRNCRSSWRERRPGSASAPRAGARRRRRMDEQRAAKVRGRLGTVETAWRTGRDRQARIGHQEREARDLGEASDGSQQFLRARSRARGEHEPERRDDLAERLRERERLAGIRAQNEPAEWFLQRVERRWMWLLEREEKMEQRARSYDEQLEAQVRAEEEREERHTQARLQEVERRLARAEKEAKTVKNQARGGAVPASRPRERQRQAREPRRGREEAPHERAPRLSREAATAENMELRRHAIQEEAELKASGAP